MNKVSKYWQIFFLCCKNSLILYECFWSHPDEQRYCEELWLCVSQPR